MVKKEGTLMLLNNFSNHYVLIYDTLGEFEYFTGQELKYNDFDDNDLLRAMVNEFGSETINNMFRKKWDGYDVTIKDVLAELAPQVNSDKVCRFYKLISWEACEICGNATNMCNGEYEVPWGELHRLATLKAKDCFRKHKKHFLGLIDKKTKSDDKNYNDFIKKLTKWVKINGDSYLTDNGCNWNKLISDFKSYVES